MRIHDVEGVLTVEVDRANASIRVTGTMDIAELVAVIGASELTARPRSRLDRADSRRYISLLERTAGSTLLRSERVGLVEEPGAFGLVADRRCRSGGLFAHDRDEARVPDLARDLERSVQLGRRGIDGTLVEFRRSDAGAGTRLASGDVCRKADRERLAVVPAGSRRISAPPRDRTASEQRESKERLAANVSGDLVGQPEARVGLVRRPAIRGPPRPAPRMTGRGCSEAR